MRKILSVLTLLAACSVTARAQSGFIALISPQGTSGSTPTSTTLGNNTCASISQSWSLAGSGTFAYETTSALPLITTVGLTPGVTLNNSTQCNDTSTTGVQMETAGSENSEWNWGVNDTPISAGAVIGASENISSNLPATDTSHIDAFDIRGQQDFTTNDYVNAMQGGSGTERWWSLECSSGQDLSVADAPISVVSGLPYNIEFIWNPATGSVTVSGTSVTLNSGSSFTSALLNGLAKIYIGGQATANAYTVASVNSTTSLTLSGSGPTNGTYTYYAAHYMKVRAEFQNASYPGVVISTQYCANEGGVDADLVNFGNSNNNTPTSGYVFNFGTILVTLGEPINSPGVSPIDYYPASLGSSDVQTALTDALAGGVVVLPIGSATWTSQVSGTVTGPLTIVGYTLGTAGDAPGSQGSGLAFSDNTSITMSVTGEPALSISGCSATDFCRITGITATNTTSNSAIGGAVAIGGTHGQVSYRVDNLDLTNQASTFLVTQEGYGLRDHILYNGNSGGGDYSFSSSGGDFSSGGYLNWQDATDLGTNQADITEDSNITLSSAGNLTDGYFGCKVTIRYNQISGGAAAGLTHGTDSGGYRSCVDAEIYNNTMASSSTNNNPWSSRGGVVLFDNNTLGGSTQFKSLETDYYRANTSDSVVASAWGFLCSGCNWTPTTVGGSSNVLNPQASAFVASHSYSADSTVLGGGDNFWTSSACTSGSAPSWPGTIGDTVTTGTCTFQNIGGGTGVPPGSSGTNAGFLSSDNETTCSSGSTCTRFFDASGGYPGRDQCGIAHGQITYGNYQWDNTGSEVPSTWWSTDAPGTCEVSRDNFNAAPSGYTAYVYPDPLQGAAASAPAQTTPAPCAACFVDGRPKLSRFAETIR